MTFSLSQALPGLWHFPQQRQVRGQLDRPQKSQGCGDKITKCPGACRTHVHSGVGVCDFLKTMKTKRMNMSIDSFLSKP